jgi:uncharacterized protein (DUF1330 family)
MPAAWQNQATLGSSQRPYRFNNHQSADTTLPAYAIANIEVTDQKGYDEYRSRTLGNIEKLGGRSIARGGATEVKECHWEPHRLILLQFDDMETAGRWYDSGEYQSIIKYRIGTANTDMVLLDGLPA